MSQGNACAAIGLANTNKIPMIGNYDQVAVGDLPAGPSAEGPYIGVNGMTWWASNPVSESDWSATNGFTVPANNGAATGKTARLGSNSGGAMTVSADQTCSVSAAGVIAAGTAQAYKTLLPVGTIVPINSFLWVYLA